MSTSMDPGARLIQPDGLPLAIIVLSCIFLGLSLITVSLRTITRLTKGIFGWDDGFMIAGTVVYAVATGLAVYSCLVGMGRLTQDLNTWQQSQAMKYYIIWILTYVVALATVKSSICITIMRIASTKINLRIAVYCLLAITWGSFFTTFIGTLLYCRPVKAIWTPQLIMSGEGSCAPVETFVVIGHVATVTTILTDLALVVVPAIILWNTQMKKQAKFQAFGLLSFASVASVITMVRIPYVNRFEAMTDLQFWVAHTMLCSNIETGIGCVASSVPSLRHFFRRGPDESSSGPSNKRTTPNRSNNLLTIGSQPHRYPSPAGFGITSGRAEDTWERLHDGSSDRSEALMDPQGKHQERTYTHSFEMDNIEKDSRGLAR